MDDGSEGPSANNDGALMRASTSPLGRLALLAIALVFTVAGVWFFVMSLRSDQRLGLAFSVFWLLGLWWYLINFSYDTVLSANGDVRFRLFWGHRLINASKIRSVKVARGEGNSWLVVRANGPRVRMGNSSRHRELIRLIGTMNPSIELPRQILDSSN